MIELFLDTGLTYSGEQYHNDGDVFGGIGVVDRNDPVELQINANGLTLLETTPTILNSGGFSIVTNSGEMYLSGFQLKTSTGFYDLNEIDRLGYNYAGTGDRYFSISTGYTEMWETLSGQFNGTYTGWGIYLNGQKLVSGDSYIEGTGSATWIDSDTGVTGAAFTMPTFPLPNLYYSGLYDISGVGFNECIAYLNGIVMDEDDFLKIGSVVECIETGLEPTVEFNLPREGTTVFL